MLSTRIYLLDTLFKYENIDNVEAITTQNEGHHCKEKT